MLIQLKNAQSVGHGRVLVPFSKMNLAVITLLKDGGFIDGFEKKKRKLKKSEVNFIDVKLNSDDGKKINNIKLVSKPSRRMYIGKKEIRPVMEGHGMLVVTTPRGVISGEEAKKQGVGGEALFEVW
ncbi:MAG: 30S ribosomal protein S8 [bacterium]|nr:30S ribosomal protein S8 [bacterium]